MPRVLILSSHVAASRVGGSAQALALARLGIEPVLVPTVLFGRHPGWGPPGGAAVEAEVFEAVIGGAEAQGLFGRLDAVITGYFASAEQVAIAAETLARVKAASPAARLVVDPIMGDAGPGLYVREPVAEAIADVLVPLADLVAPNAWELERLTGAPASTVEEALAAARLLARPALVSSVKVGDDIAVLYADDELAWGRGPGWIAAHAAQAGAPNGTGDLLTALFTAALVESLPIADGLRAAVSGVVEAVNAAQGAAELPIQAFPQRLSASPRVRLEALHG